MRRDSSGFFRGAAREQL
jgi:hypothetical protein